VRLRGGLRQAAPSHPLQKRSIRQSARSAERIEEPGDVLSEALNELVTVAENGGRRKITKRQAIITQLVNQSAKADWRATKILLDILQAIESRSESAPAETSSFSEADEKVLEQLRARFSQGET